MDVVVFAPKARCAVTGAGRRALGPAVPAGGLEWATTSPSPVGNFATHLGSAVGRSVIDLVERMMSS